MGKQAYDPRTALANALSTSGVPAAVPPPKKEPVKETPSAGQGRKKKEEKPAEPPPKTRKEIEEEQRRLVQEAEQKKAEFFAAEAAKKAQELRGAEAAVTYIEDRDTRKPKAVSDISKYWVTDFAVMPFMPSDNVGPVEVPEDVDVSERLEYLQLFNEQLEKLLKLRFHIFWSQMIFDEKWRRCLDSYLRFCLRNHDITQDEAVFAEGGEDLIVQEEKTVAEQISRRVLAVFYRLSRPQETTHDFISHGKFGQFIHEHRLFDVPKLIDICAIYGDSNRDAVTRIVHSVFHHQPLFKDDFQEVVQHMLNGLRECCEPLRKASGAGAGRSGLSIQDCLTFLPDILSCFNAVFCFFPEDCVEMLMKGKLSVSVGAPAKQDLLLVDLLADLHDAVVALDKQGGAGDGAPPVTGIVPLLSRLLTCVLGFQMAPRRGAVAFEELLEWLGAQEDRGELLQDLGRYGLENVAMEWLASGLVDDAQLGYLENLCGAFLPKDFRVRRRPTAAATGAAALAGGSSASAPGKPGQGGQGGPAKSSASDAAKIREIREVVGSSYGEGFLLQCLLHYGGSVPAVVGGILDETLPPQLAVLPIGLSLEEEPAVALAPRPDAVKLSAEDKRRVVAQASRMDEARAAITSRVDVSERSEYDDDFDDTLEDTLEVRGVKVGGNESDLDRSEDSDQGSSDEEGDGGWTNDRGPGGRIKGKGKGGKGQGGKGQGAPVQGQTIQARRKEENKGKVANHNRRDRAMWKMSRGM